jgi:hypothetical protein
MSYNIKKILNINYKYGIVDNDNNEIIIPFEFNEIYRFKKTIVCRIDHELCVLEQDINVDVDYPYLLYTNNGK